MVLELPPGRSRLRHVSRSTLLAVTLLVCGLVGLWLLTWHLVERDRSQLLTRFADDRLRQVREAARNVAADMEDVAEDLELVGKVLTGGGDDPVRRRQVLTALLGIARPYRAAAVYGTAPQATLHVLDPRNDKGQLPDVLARAMASTARQALFGREAGVHTSPPISGATVGWYRVFAIALHRGQGRDEALSLLVDTHPFLEKFRLLANEPASRLLVVGPHGKLAPVSSDRMARALERDRSSDTTSRIIDDTRAGRAGKTTLTREQARRLGLEPGEILATWAPIRIQGAAPWGVATFNRISAIQAHERRVLLRLGLAAGGFAVLLLAFGTYIIVSGRRQAVLRERLARADELAHLREKAERILESIPTGVVALAEDLRVLSINRALRQKLPDAQPGMTLAAVFSRATAGAVAVIEQALEQSRGSGSVTSLHGQPLALFGREGQYTLHAVPLGAGLPKTRFLLVLEDVTEVRALESQLLRAEKLATVGVLAAGVAHEVGTPLGVVRGRAEYLLGKLGDGHKDAGNLQVIIEQIDRVTRVIRELLDFSRVKPADVAPLRLAPLVRQVVDLLRYELERRTVSVEVTVPEDLPPVAANPDQLQQVLVNLLINARDASPQDGRVRLSARVCPASDVAPWPHVEIEVADSGGGIPRDQLLQVFDPFFTTKKRGQGTGLGLTVVSQIVGNHGARISLESEPGRGTRVVLQWPLSREGGRDGR